MAVVTALMRRPDPVAALREENEILRERIAQLEEILTGAGWAPPVEWRLTPQEGIVARVLVGRTLATRHALLTALYGDRDDAPPHTTLPIILVKLRRKLRPFGIAIHTRYMQGWHLDPPVRTALAAGAVRCEPAPPAPSGAV